MYTVAQYDAGQLHVQARTQIVPGDDSGGRARRASPCRVPLSKKLSLRPGERRCLMQQARACYAPCTSTSTPPRREKSAVLRWLRVRRICQAHPGTVAQTHLPRPSSSRCRSRERSGQKLILESLHTCLQPGHLPPRLPPPPVHASPLPSSRFASFLPSPYPCSCSCSCPNPNFLPGRPQQGSPFLCQRSPPLDFGLWSGRAQPAPAHTPDEQTGRQVDR